ncbi:MAG: acyl carrier protein [Polyangiaceae bacterium]|nr:acyl carrier protein [Polyangiaceae bacterium]
MNLPEHIAKIIIERLELEGFDAQTFPKDMLLFAPDEHGGLGLDSLASLEIIAGLSTEFSLPFDDVAEDDFHTVNTLAAYVERKKKEQAP